MLEDVPEEERDSAVFWLFNIIEILLSRQSSMEIPYEMGECLKKYLKDLLQGKTLTLKYNKEIPGEFFEYFMHLIDKSSVIIS